MLKVTVTKWEKHKGEDVTTTYEVLKVKQIHSPYMRELWVDLYLTDGMVQPIDLQNCEVIIEEMK